MNLSKLIKSFSQSLLVLALLITTGPSFSASSMPTRPKTMGTPKAPVKLTMLEFSAGWCVSCQLLKPEVKKLETEAGPALRVINLDIDQPASQPYVKAYRVLATPTIILFDAAGKPVQRLESDLKPGELRSIVLAKLNSHKP
jgi:thiol-disulfide isomerase/thioredoxin